MSVVVVTPPELVVSLDQIGWQCRAADYSDDDQLLLGLAATAQGWLDGPGGWLGRAIGPQTLELRLDSFPPQPWGFGLDWSAWNPGEWARWARPSRFSSIPLPYPPLISVNQVTYEDQNGVDQVLSATGWNAVDGEIAPSFGSVWPSGRIEADAVRIQYQAGYPNKPGGPNLGGWTGSTVPMPIQHAILLLVSHWYNHPDAVVGVDNRDSSTEMPLAVQDLLAPYRVWS